MAIAGPGTVPKRGKGGTLVSRQRMLHSLVHTESWAVDLAWDVIARFGGTPGLPRAFFDDFVAVAEDEARHFRVLQVSTSPGVFGEPSSGPVKLTVGRPREG